MRIMIAVDESEFSKAAINSVVSRSWLSGSEILVGSVAESVVHKATCSVEIIKVPHMARSVGSPSSSTAGVPE